MVDVSEGCLTATDFLTVEVCTLTGLVTHYVLFFIDIGSRSVHVAGITPHPDNSWMMQIARNITDVDKGFLRGKGYLILDRDAKYSDGFRNDFSSARASMSFDCRQNPRI
jgi:putative transposase